MMEFHSTIYDVAQDASQVASAGGDNNDDRYGRVFIAVGKQFSVLLLNYTYIHKYWKSMTVNMTTPH